MLALHFHTSLQSTHDSAGRDNTLLWKKISCMSCSNEKERSWFFPLLNYPYLKAFIKENSFESKAFDVLFKLPCSILQFTYNIYHCNLLICYVNYRIIRAEWFICLVHWYISQICRIASGIWAFLEVLVVNNQFAVQETKWD